MSQRFYVLVLIKELSLDHNTTGTNKNYTPVHKTNNQVISGLNTFVRNKFNLVADNETRNFLTFTVPLNFTNIPLKADL